MSAPEPSATEAAPFHQEVPKERQTTITLHEDNARFIREIRDRVNDHVGAHLVTANDVVAIALLMAGRYDAFVAGDLPEPEDDDREKYRPLTAVIRDVMANHDPVPERSGENETAEGD